jgi:DnaK suppressor protein
MTLSKKDLAALRQTLASKRAELLEAHDRNLDAGRHSDDDRHADPMDAATRSLEEVELLGLAAHERALLSEIDRAIGKLDQGTYGLSELSGHPISVERLRAVPWARLTAEEEEQRAASGRP